MSGRRDDDMSALAWPGFVDILSAVIIMFVFFFLIVAAALYFRIIIYISKIESQIAQELVQSEHEFEFSQAQTEFAESKEQSIKVDEETESLTVFFGNDAISVLPEIKEQLENQLKSWAADKDMSEYSVNIIAARAESGLDLVARKIAVARMLNVRNVAMSAGFTSSAILPKVVAGYDEEGSSHWVKLELTKE